MCIEILYESFSDLKNYNDQTYSRPKDWLFSVMNNLGHPSTITARMLPREPSIGSPFHFFFTSTAANNYVMLRRWIIKGQIDQNQIVFTIAD